MASILGKPGTPGQFPTSNLSTAKGALQSLNNPCQKYIGLKNSRGAGDIFGFPICCSTSLPRANPIVEQLAQSGAAATGDGRGSSGEQTSILAALCGGHRRCRV